MDTLAKFLAQVAETEKDAKECFGSGNKSAGRRARVTLSELGKLTKELRKQLLDKMKQ